MIRGLTTVMVVACDSGPWLAEAVASLEAQDVGPLEILVVDDGSTDGSAAAVASRPGVVLVEQAHAGIAAARNTALDHARGEYLGFLDADDLAPPHKIRVQLAALRSDPSIAAVLGRQELLVEPGATLPPWAADASGGLPAGPPVLQPLSILVRREVADEVGRFDESIPLGHDVDWLFRLRDLGHRWTVLDDVVLLRRIHGRNQTHDRDAVRVDLFRTLQARAARRRQADQP